MAETRTTTIRQAAQQAAELDAVARVDGVSTSEAVRAAIAEHIENRRRDPAFQARLKRIIDEERVVLKRLAQ
ncbi:MAG: ribbon-helix-helix protein, CopG family [Acidimicrobiaceae bacterium]|nr:ribbon-helix-helix protein, CopG family [Acidimicrobiaceae bacterium]MXW75362.1 ribbon-helix-helix protein, CopG family [Acidimicrobiaceae bacterium]MYC41731.1 ribbon-helix-helix protein, CopG family [Acidimicrobiaceae bacterium]MYD06975.1 ribbon-helix-helix protein, CopG family [Acidimicrobiaceae bacterium]MYH89122.1 ribbon-helix-helix protein, CopG family [Acidimicrobiaceae bacterium]